MVREDWREDGRVSRCVYQPGNGTRYVVLFVDCSGLGMQGYLEDDKVWMVAVEDMGYAPGFFIEREKLVFAYEVRNRMSVSSPSDANALAWLIGKQLGMKPVLIGAEDYEETGRVPSITEEMLEEINCAVR